MDLDDAKQDAYMSTEAVNRLREENGEENIQNRKKGFRRSCRLCNKNNHPTLLGCTEFTQFIPSGRNEEQNIPITVCKLCLGTLYDNCRHNSMIEYREYLCQVKNVMFLLCNQCDHHITAQEWMKENFNPKDGKRTQTTCMRH